MAQVESVPNLSELPDEVSESENVDTGSENKPEDDVQEEGKTPEGPEVPPLNIISKGTINEGEQKEAVFRRIRSHEKEMLDLELDLWESTVNETVSQELIEELQAKQKLIHAYIVVYQNTFGGS